jgi:seryl-tRNA synthetase
LQIKKDLAFLAVASQSLRHSHPAVLENNQQADCSINVPKARRPWMGKDKIGPP